MDFGIGTYGLGYIAGLLSTLSPCVLPLVPILIATALSAHRLGPYALAIGLALSFSVIGTFVASAGASLGLDATLLRNVAAVVLIGLAIVLLSPGLQERFASASSGLSNSGNALLARFHPTGLSGQFIVGLVLGVIWSPCVGPTLGAATTVASQGRHLGQIGLLMATFGLGAGTPLVVLGSVSRSAGAQMRGRMLGAGKAGKRFLGALLLVIGLAILTGADKQFEAWVVDISPAWLTDLTTRY